MHNRLLDEPVLVPCQRSAMRVGRVQVRGELRQYVQHQLRWKVGDARVRFDDVLQKLLSPLADRRTTTMDTERSVSPPKYFKKVFPLQLLCEFVSAVCVLI